MRRYGFTLIELLIVVAIIAILAAIAFPNFLEAQTRSKVSRTKADLRSVTTGLMAYNVDHNRFPPSTLIPRYLRLIPLTTPVSYITALPKDVFGGEDPALGLLERRGNFVYGSVPPINPSIFLMASFGPDKVPNHDNADNYPGYTENMWENPGSGFDFIRYDSTNGTISDGDIWRLSDHQTD